MKADQGKGRNVPSLSRRSVVAPEEPHRRDRRAEILASAEKLFAERGFHGVSVRDIADDADVPLALVGYYFGKKAELFSSIFDQRRAYFEERVARLESLISGNANGDIVEQVVRAWAEPALLSATDEGGAAFATLIARGIWDAGLEDRRAIESHFDKVAHAFLRAMALALPDCDPGRLVWGYQYAVGSLLTHIVSSRVADLSGGTESPGGLERREELILFLANGFRALGKMEPSDAAV